MKRTFCIILLGLVAGLSAHVSWFSLSAPEHPGELGTQLAWMKANLHLNDAQLQRIKTLHEQSAPRLLALAAQVNGMKEELAAFERDRQTEGRVDFLEFARFVEERRRLGRECKNSTEQLVAAAAEVMNPQQRQQYLSLLGPALKTLTTIPSG
jgi:hypothetical protein